MADIKDTSGKPCALFLEKGKGDNTEYRAFIFEDHKDALETALHFRKAGWGWLMFPYEQVARGEKPSDMPIVQMDLFGKGE